MFITKLHTVSVNTKYGEKIKYIVNVNNNGKEVIADSFLGEWNKDWSVGTNLPNDVQWKSRLYNGKKYWTILSPLKYRPLASDNSTASLPIDNNPAPTPNSTPIPASALNEKILEKVSENGDKLDILTKMLEESEERNRDDNEKMVAAAPVEDPKESEETTYEPIAEDSEKKEEDIPVIEEKAEEDSVKLSDVPF